MAQAHQGPDKTREYKTRGGDRVILSGFTLRNLTGAIVAFPIKGTIIKKGKPRSRRYAIWTLEGAARALGPHEHDIVDLPPVLLSPPPPCLDCDATPSASHS